jgi:hypothetical protein
MHTYPSGTEPRLLVASIHITNSDATASTSTDIGDAIVLYGLIKSVSLADISHRPDFALDRDYQGYVCLAIYSEGRRDALQVGNWWGILLRPAEDASDHVYERCGLVVSEGTIPRLVGTLNGLETEWRGEQSTLIIFSERSHDVVPHDHNSEVS